MFVATSGHELGEIGAAHVMAGSRPPPDQTALWLHIGANVAVQSLTFDGTIAGDGRAVAQRNLFVSADLAANAEQAFTGVPGYDAPKIFGTDAAPGELETFRQAGYATLAGLVGSGPLFHTPFDRAAVATSAAILAEVAPGLRALVASLA